MRKIAILFIAALLAATSFAGEAYFASVSVSQTASTTTLTDARASLLLCNYDAKIAYYRAFYEGTSVVAATTSSAPIPAGTATAPVCISIRVPESSNARYKAVSLVCTTAETTTVKIYGE